MSNTFKNWNVADVERHNARVSGTKLEPAKRSTQLETGKGGIQDEIEKWLASQSHRAWWDRKRTDMPTTSREGVPDFIGVFEGNAFGAEVKRPGQKPTTKQLGELAWMRKAGARTAIVHSLEEFQDLVLKIQ